MSQVSVKWVDPHILRDKRNTIAIVPVVPLSALREVVERMISGTTKERVECVDWDAGYASALNDLLASLGEVGK